MLGYIPAQDTSDYFCAMAFKIVNRCSIVPITLHNINDTTVDVRFYHVPDRKA